MFELFASVKGPEFARMPADDALKAQLLTMQYRALTQSYQAGFPSAAFAVVMMDKVPVGRLITDSTADGIHIVYIALLPRWRGRGVASALMRAVLAHTRTLGLPCSATVAVDNTPSLRLWTALGFTELARDTTDVVLEWRASPAHDR